MVLGLHPQQTYQLASAYRHDRACHIAPYQFGPLRMPPYFYFIFFFFRNIFIYTENFFRQIACSPFRFSLHVLGDRILLNMFNLR